MFFIDSLNGSKALILGGNLWSKCIFSFASCRGVSWLYSSALCARSTISLFSRGFCQRIRLLRKWLECIPKYWMEQMVSLKLIYSDICFSKSPKYLVNPRTPKHCFEEADKRSAIATDSDKFKAHSWEHTKNTTFSDANPRFRGCLIGRRSTQR